MDETKLYIILGAALGTLVLAGVVLAVLFCIKRSRNKMRKFTLRAVTPLDDAEFESWRRPSDHAEKYAARPTLPASTYGRRSPTVFEKELSLFDHAPRSPSPDGDIASPLQSPTSVIRKPSRVKRKTSVASSLADRPPTPYSPTLKYLDNPRTSMSSRRSYRSFHHPTKSEASDFRFEFAEFETHQTRPQPLL